MLVTTGIVGTLNGITLGGISAAKGGGVKGFFLGFARGFLIGGEASAALFLAASTGRLAPTLASAFIGGLVLPAIDATAAALLHKPAPALDQLLIDFETGFANAAVGAAFKGVYTGFAAGGTISFFTSVISQEIANVNSPHPTDLGDVLTNAAVSATISFIASGYAAAYDAQQLAAAKDLIEADPNLARQVVNGVVAGIFGYGTGSLTKVIRGLATS